MSLIHLAKILASALFLSVALFGTDIFYSQSDSELDNRGMLWDSLALPRKTTRLHSDELKAIDPEDKYAFISLSLDSAFAKAQENNTEIDKFANETISDREETGSKRSVGSLRIDQGTIEFLGEECDLGEKKKSKRRIPRLSEGPFPVL